MESDFDEKFYTRQEVINTFAVKQDLDSLKREL